MDRLRLTLAAALVPLCLLPAPVIDQVKVVRVPARQTDMSSGKEMYKEYCAVCHGVDGRGSARTAQALKTPVPDLTTVAKRHTTKDVSDFVQTVLRVGRSSAHRTSDMPDWRPVLFRLSGAKEELALLRRVNLGNYVASLQGK